MIKQILSLFAVALIGTTASAQLFFEDFEGGTLPVGWAIATNATDGGFIVSDNSASAAAPIPATSIYAATNDDVCNCDKTGEQLWTPSISIPAEGTYLLTMDYWFVNGDWEGDDETAGISISTDGGTTFEAVVDFALGSAEWQVAALNLADYAGQDIIIAFTYDDGGGWNYAYAVDNVEVSELTAVAASTDGVNLPEIAAIDDGGIAISLVVENEGAEDLTSYNFNYQVDGGAVVTEAMTMTIPSLSSMTIDHPTLYTASATGDQNVVAWISDLNGTAELANESNADVQIVQESTEGFAFSETFTSNTCGPCAAFNPPYSVELDALNANSSETDILAIKYQVNWPAPGTDVCYNADSQMKIDQYGINGVPQTLIQGAPIEFVGATWGDAAVAAAGTLPEFAEERAFMDMDITATISGTTINVTVDLTSKANFDAGNVLYVAIVNDEYGIGELNAAGTNGETEFDRVMRKMLPDGNGTDLGALTLDQQASFDFSYEYTLGDVAQNNFNMVNEDISIVAFVQNPNTTRVRQAESGELITSITEFSSVANIGIFPNPTSDVANVSVNLTESRAIAVTVTNILGEQVFASYEGLLPVGLNTMEVDTRNWNSGVYFVTVASGDDAVTSKLVVTK